MRKSILYFSLLILLASFDCLTAQNSVDTYGLLIGGGRNRYSSDLRQSKYYTYDIPRFVDGTSPAFSIGGFYEHWFSSLASFSARLYFRNANANISSDIPSTETLQGSPVNVIMRNNLSCNLNTISLEPLFRLRIYDGIGLKGGFALMWMLESNSNYYSQQIISPEGAHFDDGSTIREAVSEGSNSAGKFCSSVVVGVDYELPFKFFKDLKARFEVTGAFGYYNISKAFKLDYNNISAGLTFHLPVKSPEKPMPAPPLAVPEPQLPKELPSPLPEVQTPSKEDAVAVIGIKNGIRTNTSSIRIESYNRKRVTPLPPYVFFDRNSASIPERYLRPAGKESRGPVEDYRNILNVVADRMISEPDAKLDITGCNSDESEEYDNTKLSMARADAVAGYLVSKGVPAERIVKHARNLPEKFSGTFSEDGKAENRRAELVSNIASITAPVTTRDTVEIAEFDTLIAGHIPTDKPEKVVLKFADNSSVDIVPDPSGFAVIDIKSLLSARKPAGDNLRILITPGLNGDSVTVVNISLKKLTLEMKSKLKKADKYFEELSLILFDYDKSDPGKTNLELIEDLNRSIDKNSEVTVEGYTDRTGSDEYDMNLSRERARKTAEHIKARSVKSTGYGKTAPLYDNEFPEGRFFNRTVRILIETEK